MTLKQKYHLAPLVLPKAKIDKKKNMKYHAKTKFNSVWEDITKDFGRMENILYFDQHYLLNKLDRILEK